MVGESWYPTSDHGTRLRSRQSNRVLSISVNQRVIVSRQDQIKSAEKKLRALQKKNKRPALMLKAYRRYIELLEGTAFPTELLDMHKHAAKALEASLVVKRATDKAAIKRAHTPVGSTERTK